MKIQDAYTLMRDTIRFELRHKHYDRTVDIARWCHQMMTGEGQAEFLIKYRDQETKKQHETRLRLTNSLTTFAIAPAENMFKRVDRVDNVHFAIGHDDENKLQEVTDTAAVYHGKSSIEAYQDERLRHFNFHDPNAFILNERADQKSEDGILATEVYPIEVSAEQAINYRYRNGVCQWLIFEHKRTERVEKGNGWEDVVLSDYYLYSAGISLHYKEVVKPTEGANTEKLVMPNRQTRIFEVYEYPKTKSKEFTGRKAGFKYDPVTGAMDVRVPPYYAAKNLLTDLINYKSTIDVSVNKHVFAKMSAYVPRCENTDHETGERCEDGYIGGNLNRKCHVCNGSGSAIHTSEQDLLEFKLPKDYDAWKELPSLDKLLHYHHLPIEVTNVIRDLINEAIRRIDRAIFNADVEQQPTGVTATREQHDWEAVNVVVAPYATHKSRHIELAYRCIAAYLESDKSFTVSHAYPKDLKLEPLGVLIARYNAAKEAGLPYEILWQMQCDILNKVFANDKTKIKEVKAKEALRPFKSLPAQETAMVLQGRSKTDPDRVFFENFDSVIEKAEELAKMPMWMVKSYTKQKEFAAQAIDWKIEQIQLMEGASISLPDFTEAEVVE